MRIKDGKGKTTELVFLITASVLTVALILYVLWLIRTLVAKSDKVFTIDTNASAGAPAFDFAAYEKLMGPIAPATVVVPTTTAATTTKK